MELSLSSQFNTRIPIDLVTLCSSHPNSFVATYTLSYPNHIFIVLSQILICLTCMPENYHPNSRCSINMYYFWNTMIINTHKFGIFAGDWIFYIALEYMYQTQRIFSHLSLSWTPVYIPYLIWDYSMLAFHLSSIDCSINALPLACESLFFHTDTLFASVKPIHKTPLAILTLRI